MQSTRTRSQKAKATPKVSDLGMTVAVKSKRAKAKNPLAAGPKISAQERHTLIARAAYFRAEKRGFAPGGELQDWVEAEAEVLRLTGGA